MTSLEYEKWIYDNVHGYIGITKIEREIVDTKIFQRLRRITHLGLASFIYPGATHTRFAHSIGALFVMQKMCETLVPQGRVRKEDLQILRLAALLHDVGHYPFSHVTERLLSKTDARGKHINLAIDLIKKSELGEILSRNHIQSTDLEKILLKKWDPEYPIYSYLIDSDLDVDKIDYLLRDAVHTGVAYGSIDVDRLVRTITVDKDGVMAVRDKGKQAVENLMIARYHMYQTVYFHKAVAAFELMLRKIYELLLQEKLVFGLDEILAACDKEQGAGICGYDDAYLLQAMKSYQGSNSFLKELIEMIWRRDPLSRVCEEPALTTEKNRQYILSLVSIPSQRKMIAECAKVDADWIFHLEVPSIKFSESPIKVEKEGEFKRLDEDETSIVGVLAKHSYSSSRVYTKDGLQEAVRKAIKECLNV
jgi:HD superfamily phosphohydrolase